MSDRGRVRTEQGEKRVRAILGGEVVVDTTSPLLVWEVPYYPTYYFPEADIKTELLVETGETRRSPSRGEATQYLVKAGNGEGTAYAYLDPKLPELAGHYAFVWKTMDHWFEEDEEVYLSYSRPVFRFATTYPKPTCGWTFSHRPTCPRLAPTRGRLGTGR